MADPTLDEISPAYVRDKRFDLTLELGANARANNSILINVSYKRALPQGASLPLVLEVQGPSAQSYQRREYTRVLPVALIVSPREGGPHLVTLREVAHNRWFGTLSLDVEGELLEAPKPV